MKPTLTSSPFLTSSPLLILLTLLTIFTPGCTPKAPSLGVESHTIKGHPVLCVDLDQCSDTIDFDLAEIVDSCRVIRLENRPDALIGRISGMALTGDRIYLYHQEKLLMAFDYQGKYLKPIGALGKGPYGYQYLNNIAVGGNGSVILGEPSVSEHYFIL